MGSLIKGFVFLAKAGRMFSLLYPAECVWRETQDMVAT